MATLDTLYRMEERIGDKLAAMEMQNHAGLTGSGLEIWQQAYNALEAAFARNQAMIEHLERKTA